MAVLALAFVPYAVALLLALGTPPLARTFLTPASRPKGWLFLPTWLVTVLPVWALAPTAWAAVAHAAVSAALGEGGMRAQWVGRGWVGRVWLAWALVEVPWSIHLLRLSLSLQPPLAARAEPDPQLRAMFKTIISAGLGVAVPSVVDAGGEEDDQGERALEDVLGDDERAPDVGLGGGGGSGGEPLANAHAGADDDDDADGARTVERLAHNDPRAVEFRERMRTWFFGAEWADIRRDNMLDWIAWSSFTAPSHADLTSPTQRAALAHALALVERRTGTVFSPGRNDRVKTMRLTLDPVHTHHRPLAAYLFVEAVNVLAEHDYRRRGLHRVRFGALDYLIRSPPSYDPLAPNAPQPIVYMHGLGFGHLQNHAFVRALLDRFTDRPIVVLLQENISMSVFGKRHLAPVPRKALVRSLARALESIGCYRPAARAGEQGGATVVSHSNGSTAHAWVLKDAPYLAARSLFVDPVVFCLWEGDVCFNFVYRRPTTALELLISYWIAGEPGIANTIGRFFDWSHNTLFLSSVPHAADPHKFGVVLGGRDKILDAHRVRAYLAHHGAERSVLWDEHAPHGAVLFSAARRARVLSWIDPSPSSPSAAAALSPTTVRSPTAPTAADAGDNGETKPLLSPLPSA